MVISFQIHSSLTFHTTQLPYSQPLSVSDGRESPSGLGAPAPCTHHPTDWASPCTPGPGPGQGAADTWAEWGGTWGAQARGCREGWGTPLPFSFVFSLKKKKKGRGVIGWKGEDKPRQSVRSEVSARRGPGGEVRARPAASSSSGVSVGPARSPPRPRSPAA